jgi:shikimate kinase
MAYKNIYIVGFMGTGKTTAAKLLARALKRRFIEMDEEIEKEEGMAIVDIFDTKGEAYFRKLETALLRKLSGQQGMVVSCGGGIVTDEENVALMKSTGLAVCLRALPSTIYERVRGQAHRPLINVPDPLGRIRSLLDERARYYAKADLHIDTDGCTPDEVVRQIIASLPEER